MRSDLEYPVTEEMLSAYLDGELEAHQAEALSQRLARDDVLRARLDRFRSVDTFIRGAFDPIAEESVPRMLLDAALTPTRTERSGASIARTPATRRWALPLAASVALALGVALGGGLGGGLTEHAAGGAHAGLLEPAIGKNTPLHVALETVPSDGAWRDASRDEVIVPVLTFADTAGRWCRQFEWRRAGRTLTGVACRADEGVWTPEAAVNLALEAKDGGYRPAAGDDADPLGGIRVQMMASTALDLEAEESLIARHWAGKSER